MKVNYAINPLMLLIMTQAWCHVKRNSAFPIPPAIKTNNNSNLESLKYQEIESSKINSLPINTLFEEAHIKAIPQSAWDYVWGHPFFKGELTSTPLSIRKLARNWGSVEEGFIESDTIDNLNLKDRELKNIKAIKIKWNPDWLEALPENMVDILRFKEDNNVQLWLEVDPNEKSWNSISDKSCNQAVQLGWSWWFSAPSSSDNFEDFFNALKNNFRFWFCSEHSDQWVYPWCDILCKSIAEKIVGKSSSRYWIADKRQNAAWNKLDTLTYDHVEKIIGGQSSFRSLICAIVSELEKIDFIDKPFCD